MSTYAIRMPDGSLIEDPEWHCVADVIRTYHGHGVVRVYGDLVLLPDVSDPAAVCAQVRETTGVDA